eukprot:ANDGO_02051.mRNA.1 hypothetical protein TTHERM_00085480
MAEYLENAVSESSGESKQEVHRKTYVDLSAKRLSVVPNMSWTNRLTKRLDLSCNEIADFDASVIAATLPNLEVLILNDNLVQGLDRIFPLCTLTKLKELDFRGNPVCDAFSRITIVQALFFPHHSMTKLHKDPTVENDIVRSQSQETVHNSSSKQMVQLKFERPQSWHSKSSTSSKSAVPSLDFSNLHNADNKMVHVSPRIQSVSRLAGGISRFDSRLQELEKFGDAVAAGNGSGQTTRRSSTASLFEQEDQFRSASNAKPPISARARPKSSGGSFRQMVTDRNGPSGPGSERGFGKPSARPSTSGGSDSHRSSRFRPASGSSAPIRHAASSMFEEEEEDLRIPKAFTPRPPPLSARSSLQSGLASSGPIPRTLTLNLNTASERCEFAGDVEMYSEEQFIFRERDEEEEDLQRNPHKTKARVIDYDITSLVLSGGPLPASPRKSDRPSSKFFPALELLNGLVVTIDELKEAYAEARLAVVAHKSMQLPPKLAMRMKSYKDPEVESQINRGLGECEMTPDALRLFQNLSLSARGSLNSARSMTTSASLVDSARLSTARSTSSTVGSRTSRTLISERGFEHQTLDDLKMMVCESHGRLSIPSYVESEHRKNRRETTRLLSARSASVKLISQQRKPSEVLVSDISRMLEEADVREKVSFAFGEKNSAQLKNVLSTKEEREKREAALKRLASHQERLVLISKGKLTLAASMRNQEEEEHEKERRAKLGVGDALKMYSSAQLGGHSKAGTTAMSALRQTGGLGRVKGPSRHPPSFEVQGVVKDRVQRNIDVQRFRSRTAKNDGSPSSIVLDDKEFSYRSDLFH